MRGPLLLAALAQLVAAAVVVAGGIVLGFDVRPLVATWRGFPWRRR